MNKPLKLIAQSGISMLLCAAVWAQQPVPPPFQRVLLISIDGMHALDLMNCSSGVPTCPNLARLAASGVNYLQASTSKPSDSFPGLLALVTGASPRTTGVYYDVSYDRYLAPPKAGGGKCPIAFGTAVTYDESVDVDSSRLDGGGGINPDMLPRDPYTCAAVYPHSFIRSNTIFEVIRANGGYTAWTDKHPAYEIVNGPSGKGVMDLYTPEINSQVVALPNVPGCTTVKDPKNTGSWTDSFQNIQCYDSLKVQAIINQIDGKKSDGSAATQVPTIFGMNFQAVSVGQKLNDKQNGIVGGYLDATGTPSAALAGQIKFVDASIGQMVSELKSQGLLQSTLIIVSAKHGQSPIGPKSIMRIPADNKSLQAPSDVLGSMVASAIEDDVSLIWLNNPSTAPAATQMLQSSLSQTGGGEIFSGAAMRLLYGDPMADSRVPDLIVTPNIGVIYTGGTKKLAEHGGFANDDTNVLLIVSNPSLPPGPNPTPVSTVQVAPTILRALGMDPGALIGVQKESTQALPGLPFLFGR